MSCEPELEREDLCEAHEVDFRSVEEAKASLPDMGYVAEPL
ncbi:MAG: hypothetical protein ACOX4B_10040 [Bacillota bacterium]